MLAHLLEDDPNLGALTFNMTTGYFVVILSQFLSFGSCETIRKWGKCEEGQSLLLTVLEI